MNGKKEESEAGEWPRLGEALKQERGGTLAPSNTQFDPTIFPLTVGTAMHLLVSIQICILACQRSE